MTLRRSRRSPSTAAVAARVGAAIGALVVAHAAPSVLAIPRVRARLSARVTGVGDGGRIALTFDDGPNPVSTPRFLEALDESGVKATFFMLGCMAARAPALSRAIVEAGHEVALHGWSHRILMLRGPAATYADLARARSLIADLTGQEPRFFRPPHGLFSTPALVAAARLELTPVLWTCWGRDWKPQATPESILAKLRPGLNGGATILLHDADGDQAPCAWRSTLRALPWVLEECARRGLRVGPLRDHVTPTQPAPATP
ncbi:polysaccharide deacetylase family protein [Rugosimonospora acidiphila]|uniref:Polysaccharide deacetylase family protein n=1 Tax=Rugosimonospora acidiphila TaxID=556531 RepID=A0ABP9RY83_9ACTN